MPSLIMLIVYAVMAAAAAGIAYKAWDGFKQSVAAPYVAAQIKSDQARLDKADAAQKAAEADLQTARGNTGRCESSLKISEQGKSEAEKRAKDNIAEARKSKADSDRERAAARPYIAGLQADAAAKADKALTCEQQLSKADKVLTEALRRGRIPPAVTK